MGRPTNIQQVCKIIELISAWHTWTTHRMHCTVQSHCHLDNNKRNVQQGAKHACLRSYTIIRAGLSNFLFTRHVSQLPWRSSLLPCCYMSLVLALTPSNPSGLVFLEQRYSEPSHRRSKTSEQSEAASLFTCSFMSGGVSLKIKAPQRTGLIYQSGSLSQILLSIQLCNISHVSSSHQNYCGLRSGLIMYCNTRISDIISNQQGLNSFSSSAHIKLLPYMSSNSLLIGL